MQQLVLAGSQFARLFGQCALTFEVIHKDFIGLAATFVDMFAGVDIVINKDSVQLLCMTKHYQRLVDHQHSQLAWSKLMSVPYFSASSASLRLRPHLRERVSPMI
jgi:hypothetical protein